MIKRVVGAIRRLVATTKRLVGTVQRLEGRKFRLLSQTSEVFAKHSRREQDFGSLLANGIIVFMPRRLIPFVSEGYYHIYNRGNNRGAIFFEQENYFYFLQGVKKYLLPAADVIAYCLMPTHYHLMVRAMQKLLISYTKAINKRFERVGALFQGAFQAKPITSSSHLLHLCRYIHANPVKDGLVTDPSDWPYSNYLEWIGERDGTLIDRNFIQTQFPNPIDYKDFVLDYVRKRKMPEDVLEYLNTLEA
jgi:putative transposase